MVNDGERDGILETAHRVKQIIQQVFRYAVRKGLIEYNPAGDLRDIISHAPVRNRACIPPAELPALLHAIEGYVGSYLTVAAIKLLALTFVRTGEMIASRWEEIDWARAEWAIPAERMKMRRPHVVPLSSQAIAILEVLHAKTGKHGFIFFSPANNSKHISNNAVLIERFLFDLLDAIKQADGCSFDSSTKGDFVKKIAEFWEEANPKNRATGHLDGGFAAFAEALYGLAYP